MKSLNDGSAIEFGISRGISRVSSARIYVGDKPRCICRMRLDRSDRARDEDLLGFPTEMLRNIARADAWQRSINPRGIIKSRALLRACIYVRKHFRRGSSAPLRSLVGPMKRKEERGGHNAVSLAPRENRRKYAGNVSFRSRRCLISRYVPRRVFMQTRFPRKSRLISRVSASGNPAVGAHILLRPLSSERDGLIPRIATGSAER